MVIRHGFSSTLHPRPAQDEFLVQGIPDIVNGGVFHVLTEKLALPK